MGGFFIDNISKNYRVTKTKQSMHIDTDSLVALGYIILMFIFVYPVCVLIQIRTEVNENQNNLDYLVAKNEPRLKPFPQKWREKIIYWFIEKFYIPKNPFKK